MGYSPWGLEESDMTEQLTFTSHQVLVMALRIFSCSMWWDLSSSLTMDQTQAPSIRSMES